MLIRNAQGSLVLSNGPRYTAYAGVSCFSAPYRVLQELAVSRYFTPASRLYWTALVRTPRVSPQPTTRMVSPLQSMFSSGAPRPSGSSGELEALGLDVGVSSGPALAGGVLPVVKPTTTPAVTPTRADTRSAAVPRASQRIAVRLDRGRKGCHRSSSERPQRHRAQQV